MVEQSSLVSEQILLEFHHIECCIEFSELYFEAILPIGISIFIIPNLSSQGFGEGSTVSNPFRKPLSTKLPNVQILMGIQDDIDIEFGTFPDNVPQNVQIGIVVLASFGLKSFPCSVQSDGVHAPFFEVNQVVVIQAGVGVVVDEVGVEGEGLVDCVYSMEYSESVVLVHEEAALGVHPNWVGQDEECCYEEDDFEHGDYLYIIQVMIEESNELNLNNHRKSSDEQMDLMDDTVIINPINMVERVLNFNSLPRNKPRIEQKKLGIYSKFSLASLFEEGTSGELLPFISIANDSLTTFLTDDAKDLLESYSSQNVAFVVVMGNRNTGKSFFCDKILNLGEVRGNYFCRNKEAGIYVWSRPFIKEDLKIFVMELCGCGYSSSEFQMLAYYVLLLGAAIVNVRGIEEAYKNSFEELDGIFANLLDRISKSNIQKENDVKQRIDVFLPKVIYNLNRPNQSLGTKQLHVMNLNTNQQLPNAMCSSYTGLASDLAQVPFLDNKCVDESYVKSIHKIFMELYEGLSQKKYNELTMNGRITEKIATQISTYLNNCQQPNIHHIYYKIVQELYLSSYNYCILSYHHLLQEYLQDEQPKSIEDLLEVFQKCSNEVLDNFSQFTLDKELHEYYEGKLVEHIDEKQEMIMKINKKKGEHKLDFILEQPQFNQEPKQVMRKLDGVMQSSPYLNQGMEGKYPEFMLNVYRNFGNSNNVDYRLMKEIQNIQGRILDRKEELKAIKLENDHEAKQKNVFVNKQRALDKKLEDLNFEINKSTLYSMKNISNFKDDYSQIQKIHKKNDQTIEQLTNSKEKPKQVKQIEGRIEDVRDKIKIQEKMLKELTSKREEPKEERKKKK